MLYGRLRTGRCGTAERNVATSGTTANRAISLQRASSSVLVIAPGLPCLQRLFEFHAPRSLQQYDISVPRFARQPLACFFGSRYKLSPGSCVPGAIYHGLGKPADTQEYVHLLLADVPTRFAVHFFSGWTKF